MYSRNITISTFHSVYISTIDLHIKLFRKSNLHSTLFILVLFYLTRDRSLRPYLHSTLFILVHRFMPGIVMFSCSSTFHSVYISTYQWALLVGSEVDLHSTLFILVR